MEPNFSFPLGGITRRKTERAQVGRGLDSIQTNVVAETESGRGGVTRRAIARAAVPLSIRRQRFFLPFLGVGNRRRHACQSRRVGLSEGQRLYHCLDLSSH